jgi:Chromate transporter
VLLRIPRTCSRALDVKIAGVSSHPNVKSKIMTNPQEECKDDDTEDYRFTVVLDPVDEARDGVDAIPANGKTNGDSQREGDQDATIDATSDDPVNPKQRKMTVAADAPWTERVWEVFTTFWPLGLIAFGGPAAHVAILRDHLVVQRDWLDEDQFMELFAIGQVSTVFSLC